jgi:short-subunit dehydrogenase
MTFFATGKSTTIVQALIPLSNHEEVFSAGRAPDNTLVMDFSQEFDVTQIPTNLERYVLAAGLLRSKTLSQQSFKETADSIAVNLTSIIRICDYLVANNPRARIAILSSESARGSFDTTYFMCKAALNQYIERKKLAFADQQIVGIAPTIIMDSGMTQRRADMDNVLNRAQRHPKCRYLSALEVARMIYHLLWIDSGYTSNTIIHMNGGEFA